MTSLKSLKLRAIRLSSFLLDAYDLWVGESAWRAFFVIVFVVTIASAVAGIILGLVMSAWWGR